MIDDRDKLIAEAVEKGLQGDMDTINGIEDRVIRSKAKAALHKAKKMAKESGAGIEDSKEETASPVDENQSPNQIVFAYLEKKIPGSVIVQEGDLEECIYVNPSSWEAVSKLLRNDEILQFDSLQCITGIDIGEGILESRYNFHSMSLRHTIEIRIPVSIDNPKIYSIEQIWRIGDWFEREVYDMVGIIFEGHRNLKRMLLPDDWEGFPLRKDYDTQQTYHGIAIPKVKEEWE